jgi:hypothetical protein
MVTTVRKVPSWTRIHGKETWEICWNYWHERVFGCIPFLCWWTDFFAIVPSVLLCTFLPFRIVLTDTYPYWVDRYLSVWCWQIPIRIVLTDTSPCCVDRYLSVLCWQIAIRIVLTDTYPYYVDRYLSVLCWQIPIRIVLTDTYPYCVDRYLSILCWQILFPIIPRVKICYRPGPQIQHTHCSCNSEVWNGGPRMQWRDLWPRHPVPYWSCLRWPWPLQGCEHFRLPGCHLFQSRNQDTLRTPLGSRNCRTDPSPYHGWRRGVLPPLLHPLQILQPQDLDTQTQSGSKLLRVAAFSRNWYNSSIINNSTISPFL